MNLLSRIKNINSVFPAILAFNALFFLLAAWLLPIRFEENDDIVMLLFASGKYTGTPESHLVFINVIYGCFVSALYKLYASVEWYTLVFSLIHVISLSVVCWAIAASDKKLLLKVLFLLLFYVIELRLILLFQFTTTAALCALAGLVLLTKNNPAHKIYGVLLLNLAALIRFEAALLVIMVSSPLLLGMMYRHGRFYFSKSVVYLLIAFTFIGIFRYTDNRVYEKNAGWKYFKEYNLHRGKINDNPNASVVLNKLPYGVQQLDYLLLLNFFPDTKVIGLEDVKSISGKLNDVNVWQKVSNIYPALRGYALVLALIGMLWLVVFINVNNREKRLFLILLIFIFCFSLCYVSLNGTLKYRVFLTALLPFLFVMFNLMGVSAKRISLMLLIITGVFLVVNSFRISKIAKQKKDWQNSEFVQQKELLQRYLNDERNSIVPVAADLNVEFYPAFAVSKSFCPNQLFFSGWASAIPFNHCKFDSHIDLVNHHAFFIKRKNVGCFLPLIVRAIKMNYHVIVQPVVIMETKDYCIVKLQTKSGITTNYKL